MNGHRHRFDAKGRPTDPSLPMLCVPGTCEYCDLLGAIPSRPVPRSEQHDSPDGLPPVPRRPVLLRSGDLSPLAVAVLTPRRPD